MDKKVINLDAKKSIELEWRKYVKLGLFFIILIVLFALIFASAFIVKEGEYKVVRQFQEVVSIKSEPGLAFKIPFIQSVSTLPKYQMTYDVSQAEINTKDKKRMIIDNYAVWKIDNPRKMITNARTVANAESRMEEFVYSVVRAEFGQLEYDKVINDEKSSRGSLNDRITDKVNELLSKDEYGIIVTDVRTKRTDLPQENENSVYRRMISERESKAQEYLSIGDAKKNKITAETDSKVRETISKAEADADVIRSEGEGEAAKIYNDSFSKDREFYHLFRTLETYKKTIGEETVIVIPSDSPYARLLMGYTE
ncbi:protease modulator HflC [Lederbergia lenta]|uniref:Protein HflC n=1 Tax=Lederbergia lenta TaxID=1467 RepID=A0A2X4WBL1_LEDLE|nr:protease modulator HflC [Lederbergia lenta]MCM3111136.1 protease modulator HflC [Lederbergia lenta]MEC2325476.1 protease modulator HflC [Lederbergia lenta]SQI54980.1 protease specific for phage lambda cII repressor [Lederbergia lenta]